ncbi:MAG: right-handed parallel beta-helix repeat-containing protein [Lysobacterales bacterium]
MRTHAPLACFFALACAAASANAAVVEISPGDDFRAAMQALQPGDTLVMHGGEYAFSGYTSISLAGSAAQPILIRAATGEQAWIHYVGSDQNILNIADSSFLTIDGIEFSGGSRGIRLTNVSDFTLRNCHVHDTGANAVSANDSGNDYARLTFEHNEVDHTGDTGEAFYLGCNDDACRVHDSLVANNHIHDLDGASVTQGDGIEIKAGSYANVVRDNVIHDTLYPGITLYHANGNGAPNIIERNLVWNSGDNGIQVTADAIVRNNIVLSAAAHGIGVHPSQGGSPGNLVIAGNTIIKASGDAIHINGVTGSVLVANNALYAPAGNAVYADGDTGMVGLVANAGQGALAGVDGGFDASGDITTDFVAGSYSGAPPQNLMPTGILLVGTADAATLSADDFDGIPRRSLDIGAYRHADDGQPGWTLSAGFKVLAEILFDGFDAAP